MTNGKQTFSKKKKYTTRLWGDIAQRSFGRDGGIYEKFSEREFRINFEILKSKIIFALNSSFLLLSLKDLYRSVIVLGMKGNNIRLKEVTREKNCSIIQ